MADLPPSDPDVELDPALWPADDREWLWFGELGFVDPRPNGSA